MASLNGSVVGDSTYVIRIAEAKEVKDWPIGARPAAAAAAAGG
jgi:hypothetical protein